MSGKKNQASLASEIAAALQPKHINTFKYREPGEFLKPSSRKILLAGMVLASIQPDSAVALSLGQINVKSALGQPFIATTTVRISQGETLNPSCISTIAQPLDGSSAGNKLITTVGSTAKAGEIPIRITSQRPLYEPMYEIRLQVSCPGTLSMARNYIVMLNLPMTSIQTTVDAAKAAQPQPQAASMPLPSPTRETVTQPAATTRRQQTPSVTSNQQTTSPISEPVADSIQPATRYRVKRGDTLSKIAERVSGRPLGSTYQVADLLLEENPSAFINGDPNRLKAGSLLTIPTRATLAEVGPAPRLATPIQKARSAATAPAPQAGTDSVTPDSATTDTATAAATPLVAERIPYTQVANAPEAAPRIAIQQTPELAVAIQDSSSAAPLPIIENLEQNIQAADMAALEQSLADAQAAATLASKRAAEASVETDAAAESVATGQTNPLLAGGIGALLGFLLASLLLGFRSLRKVLPQRANAVSANRFSNAANQATAKPAEVKRAPVSRVEMPAPAIAVTESEVDSGYFAAANDVAVEAAEPADSESPRVSLHDHNDRINSALDTALDFDLSGGEELPLHDSDDTAPNILASNIATDIDLEGTMSTLFSEQASGDDDTNATLELPEIDQAGQHADGVDKDITRNLQDLSASVAVNKDDELSKTLAQALGLLEQDYEEELTSSQIIDEAEAQAALSAHAAKTN